MYCFEGVEAFPEIIRLVRPAYSSWICALCLTD
uniref:Uncharacterized protein n=1 Tax=Anguilla anguilla TaxID=7936 RepID=A0A0E9RWG5_ANGAN